MNTKRLKEGCGGNVKYGGTKTRAGRMAGSTGENESGVLSTGTVGKSRIRNVIGSWLPLLE
jgi:hypothetical protein